MRRINENISLAKAILAKNKIKPESVEFKDYMKIRELCGSNTGYVGILTRLRIEEEITDFDEIESIFNILKSSKIDIGKLNRMSYDQILDLFYDELKPDSKKNKDYEIIFKDSRFTYYKVYTYEGILALGSPAWCLKTKSKWDEYQQLYPDQYVVIDNKWINKLLVPNTDITKKYNSSKPDVRFGISMNEKKYVAYDDNNDEIVTLFLNSSGPRKTKAFTQIFYTLLCLQSNIEFEDGATTEYRVVKKTDDEIIYELRGYDFIPERLVFTEKYFYSIIPYSVENEKRVMVISITVLNIKSPIYYPIDIKQGKMKVEEIENRKDFFGKINNWIILDHKDEFLVINCDLSQDELELPVAKTEYNMMTKLDSIQFKTENPAYFWLDKKTLKPVIEIGLPQDKVHIDFGKTELLIQDFLRKKLGIEEPKKPKKNIFTKIKDFLNQPEKKGKSSDLDDWDQALDHIIRNVRNGE